MHIELIGSTSAGKTTLARKMVEAGKNSGIKVSLSDDFMLEQLHLNWIKNEFIRRRLVEFVAFAIWLNYLTRYNKFLDFIIREGKSTPGSWFYRLNRIRNVIRKIGIFEFISRRSESQQIILADNEGILQGVHNLFVHQNGRADLHKIPQYVELVPLPDVILYLRQEENVLISRTIKRGHARVVGGSPEEVVNFIRQAVAVFNEMIEVPEVQERLLVVDGMLNIQSEARNPLKTDFNLVTALVQSGSSIS
jgi:broad-specificity NMP kinase